MCSCNLFHIKEDRESVQVGLLVRAAVGSSNRVLFKEVSLHLDKSLPPSHTPYTPKFPTPQLGIWYPSIHFFDLFET